MNYHNFNTSDYAKFSIGEAQAEFAKKGSWRNEPPITGGQVKAHVRRTARGGLALVKGSYRKGKRFATKRGKQALGLAKAGGQKALSFTRRRGGQTLSYAGKKARQGLNVIKKNPKAAGVVAVVGGGAYVVGSRKKRRR